MAWQDPSFAATGTNVGSSNSQDLFHGYGHVFLNPDRFRKDISPVIHMYGASAAPFLSFASMMRRQPTSQYVYSWMQDELQTHYDGKMKLVRGSDDVFYLQAFHGGAWQMFDAVPQADVAVAFDSDKPIAYVEVTDGTTTIGFHPLAGGLSYAPKTFSYINDNDDPAYSLSNALIVGDYSGGAALAVGGSGKIDGGTTAIYTKHVAICPSNSTPNEVTYAKLNTMLSSAGSVEVKVRYVSVNEQLGGFAQGSGLPNETRKRTRSDHNYTQIFKTPWSIANTTKVLDLYGGDELGRIRLRKTIQHKTDIERAIVLQGGGVEGTDWGELPSGTENPLTRFKGLGVGLAVTGQTAKPGFIVTKNCDLNSNLELDISAMAAAPNNELTRWASYIFDDTVDTPASEKMVFCSQKWMIELNKLAYSGVGAGMFGDPRAVQGNSLGVVVNTVNTAVGKLHFVPLPMLRGRFEDYALIIDFSNIAIRPLRGRDTTLYSNVGDQSVDGQLDYMLTELGFECRHESTHAVAKLVA